MCVRNLDLVTNSRKDLNAECAQKTQQIGNLLIFNITNEYAPLERVCPKQHLQENIHYTSFCISSPSKSIVLPFNCYVPHMHIATQE